MLTGICYNLYKAIFIKEEVSIMKRSMKSMMGVTLLEIMLVLAIAAMVIVMSVRYYQSASSNQKLNAGMSTVTGILAAAESYATANGTFATITNATLADYLGSSAPKSPWGGDVTVTGKTANSFTIEFPSVSTSDCTRFSALLTSSNSKLAPSCASNKVTVTVTE